MLSICTSRSFSLSDTCISSPAASSFGGSAMILLIFCFLGNEYCFGFWNIENHIIVKTPFTKKFQVSLKYATFRGNFGTWGIESSIVSKQF